MISSSATRNSDRPNLKPKALLAVLIFCCAFLLTRQTCYVAPVFAEESASILNVSYDPTRELYQQYNELFNKHWQSTTKKNITVHQSHGGSGKQARAVIEGLEADVVTLALSFDIDEIARLSKVLPADWQKRLAHNSSPYTSTIVFLVRKGNPKGIKDWDDLVKSGVEVITPNPKTSGGARWNYLAAWGYALRKFNNDQDQAKQFVKKLFQNVPVLDTGARGSTVTFVQRELGDVLLTWENEAYLALKEFGHDNFEIIAPSLSILAEPPVALVDQNVDKHGTRAVATEYLNYLYSNEAQELVAQQHYRPANPEISKKYAATFKTIELFKLEDLFGSWQEVQAIHFNEGGTFDQIYVNQ